MSQLTIQQGSNFPVLSHDLFYLSSKTDEPTAVNTRDFINGKHIIVGVPAAFSPPCSEQHLPSYIGNLGKFVEKGYDVTVVDVDNVFVNKAWADKFKILDKQDHIKFVSDLQGKFIHEIGLITKEAPFLGEVAGRFAIVLNDAKVVYYGKEASIETVDLSSAEKVLLELS